LILSIAGVLLFALIWILEQKILKNKRDKDPVRYMSLNESWIMEDFEEDHRRWIQENTPPSSEKDESTEEEHIPTEDLNDKK
jgi:hypothetical protein